MQSAMIVEIVGAIKLLTAEFAEELAQTLTMGTACSIVSHARSHGHRVGTDVSLCRLRCSLRRYVLVHSG